jgi:polyhydroxybutyrate depolymerase
MRRVIPLIAAQFAFTFATTHWASAATVQLAFEGQSRSYLIEQPNMAGARPTVIMLHGINGTAERIAQRTGLGQLGPREGFVVVFPQSRGNAWNRFAPGKESPRAKEFFRDVGGPPNDMGFLKRLVADLIQRGLSDQARIYLAGLSNGGFMTLGVLCATADTFAAIGLLVTSMPDDMGSDCRPATPLPVLMLGGTADQEVPYAGGVVSQSTLSVWSFERLTTFFRQINECDGSAGRSVVPGIQQRVEIEYSGPCRSGPVVIYRVVGGTHASAPDTLHTGQLLLDFFRDKVRRPPSSAQPLAQPPGAVTRIMYRRSDGPTLVTGELTRGTANEWVETNTRGSKWNFRANSESNSEILLYDANRDVYVRMDLGAKKMFVRKGPTQEWRFLADIVGTERK